MAIPDYTEYITGWRFWMFSMAGYLYPIGQQYFVWPPRVPATAHRVPRLAPREWYLQETLSSWPDVSGLFAYRNPFLSTPLRVRLGCLSQTMAQFKGYERYNLMRPVPPDMTKGVTVIGGWVFGRVALWGNIIGHEYGYRAQHGYPLELHGVFTETTMMPTTLHQHYGVPVTAYKSVRTLVNAVFPDTPEELNRLGWMVF